MQTSEIFTIVYTNAIDSVILDLQTKDIKMKTYTFLNTEITTHNEYSGHLCLPENNRIFLSYYNGQKYVLNNFKETCPSVEAWCCATGNYHLVSKSEIVSAYLKVG